MAKSSRRDLREILNKALRAGAIPARFTNDAEGHLCQRAAQAVPALADGKE